MQPWIPAVTSTVSASHPDALLITDTASQHDYYLLVTEISMWLRHGTRAVAAGRVALGLTALAWPSVPARPWTGAAADDLTVRVFGRALGARDVALGLGALAALELGGEAGSASAWVAAGALSDALDVAASAASWRDLPRVTRWLVAASAGGAAVIGVAGAIVVREKKELRETYGVIQEF